MSGSWHGGKGSKARPMSVTQEEYDKRWDAIFGRDLEETIDNDYQDILSTEECVEEALFRYNEETQEVKRRGIS